jgi:simple sugar transport system substrate-binding protein
MWNGLDPTQVVNQMFDQSVDVVISGIDTTEAMLVTKDRAAKGEKVWSIPYDYEGACDVAPQVCLGVPYFNWGPGYLKYATQVIAGTWAANWEWEAPNWADMNNRDTSAVGFKFGPALIDNQASELNQFIAGLANGTTNLFQGPLNFQDNSPFLKEGEVATDKQIWYMPQLLQGMTGLSQ